MAHSGVLNVNKPAGWTSRGVVNHVARLCRPAKAGHAGTLDPLATGVLVICVGQATRLIPYVQKMRKRYRATFQLGRSSDTDDSEGEIRLLIDVPTPTAAEVERVLPQFLGRIAQQPPAHSAIKIQGRRAYELARKGTAVELNPRIVEIHHLQIVRYDYPELELEIECGSGTYVRALGRDLAAALGTAAVMSALERSAIGRFCIDSAASVDEINPTTFAQLLQRPLAAVADLPQITVNEWQLRELHHGRPIPTPPPELDRSAGDLAKEWAALDQSGQLVAILREKCTGQLWLYRNFT